MHTDSHGDRSEPSDMLETIILQTNLLSAFTNENTVIV